MPRDGDVHVVWRDAQRKWAVEVTGSDRARMLSDSKQPAEQRARELARRNGTELFVHDKSDRIQRRDSEGNDPRRTRG
jgi:hypothetical protein